MRKISDILLKVNLLSNGVALSQSVLNNYGYPYLEKRRAYGNPDPIDIRAKTIPQELYTLPARLVTAVNVNHNSPWKLVFDDNKYYITDEQEIKNEVTFPNRPKFYDELLTDGYKVSQLITLYGGSALGIFVYGKCHLFEKSQACSFCSVFQNRSKGTDFPNVITQKQVEEGLPIALSDLSVDIKQVMINGGTSNNLDKSFSYYANIAKTAERIIEDTGKELGLHLIVFPPRDFSLFEELRDTNIGLIMNTEVYDSEMFKKYCPGKDKVFGREKIFKALEKAVDLLPKGNVYSVILGGLEPIDSLYKGLVYLAERGITPIINILHTDPETPLEIFPNPSVNFILEMGYALQEVYDKYQLKACYRDCGRNSIDTEASMKLFTLNK